MPSNTLVRKRNRAETIIKFASEMMARHTASGLISCGYHVKVKVLVEGGAIVKYKKVNIV